MTFGELLTFLHLRGLVHETKVLYSYMRENNITKVYWSRLLDHYGNRCYICAETMYSITSPFGEEDSKSKKRYRLIRADLVFTPYLGTPGEQNQVFIPNAKIRQLERHLLS